MLRGSGRDEFRSLSPRMLTRQKRQSSGAVEVEDTIYLGREWRAGTLQPSVTLGVISGQGAQERIVTYRGTKKKRRAEAYELRTRLSYDE